MSVAVTFRFQGCCELWASIWFANFFIISKNRHWKLKPCYSVRSYRTGNHKRCYTFSRWPWLMCELLACRIWNDDKNLPDSLQKREKLLQYNTIEDAVRLIQQSQRILILTGAGISGLQTLSYHGKSLICMDSQVFPVVFQISVPEMDCTRLSKPMGNMTWTIPNRC